MVWDKSDGTYSPCSFEEEEEERFWKNDKEGGDGDLYAKFMHFHFFLLMGMMVSSE